MFHIRPAADADYDQVRDLLCRLQAAHSHHIGYHGETETEIADELSTLRFPEFTTVATDDAGHIRGVLSVDIDRSLGRAWWYGPYVDVPAEHPAADRIWSRTADALYDTASGALRGVTDTELYGHVEHCRLADFARRHGFPAGEYSSVLMLDGVDLVRMVGAVADEHAMHIGEFPTPPTESTVAAAFIRLHDELFPNTYLSAATLLAGDPEHTVIAATDDGRLIGYAVGSAQPHDYFIDFVGVATEFRGRGIGTALVTTLVQRLADQHGARSAACAVVAGGNEPSRRMFRGLGFVPHKELVSYRLRATSQAA